MQILYGNTHSHTYAYIYYIYPSKTQITILKCAFIIENRKCKRCRIFRKANASRERLSFLTSWENKKDKIRASWVLGKIAEHPQ